MDYSKIPSWLLSVALALFAFGFLISLFLLDEPKNFMGLSFGPNPPNGNSLHHPEFEKGHTHPNIHSHEKETNNSLLPVAIGPMLQNSGSSSILVFGYCNATKDHKEINGHTGKNGGSLQMVASESGVQRASLSFVVPAGWSYRVGRSNIAGIGCKFNSVQL